MRDQSPKGKKVKIFEISNLVRKSFSPVHTGAEYRDNSTDNFFRRLTCIFTSSPSRILSTINILT